MNLTSFKLSYPKAVFQEPELTIGGNSGSFSCARLMATYIFTRLYISPHYTGKRYRDVTVKCRPMDAKFIRQVQAELQAKIDHVTSLWEKRSKVDK